MPRNKKDLIHNYFILQPNDEATKQCVLCPFTTKVSPPDGILSSDTEHENNIKYWRIQIGSGFINKFIVEFWQF